MTNEEIITKIRLFADEQRNLLTDFESNSNFRKGEITAYSAIIAFLSELEKSLPAKVMAGEELENELVRFYLKDLCASEDDELTDATRHHHFPIMWDDLRDIARHFYELGCRRTAEKADEIEYNRQRAEESVCDELEEEIDRMVKCEKDFMNFQCMSQLIGYMAHHFAQWGAEHLKK